MHVRLQTWFPFTIQVYINGHEWLARKMTRHGIAYTQVENIFIHIENCRLMAFEIATLPGISTCRNTKTLWNKNFKVQGLQDLFSCCIHIALLQKYRAQDDTGSRCMEPLSWEQPCISTKRIYQENSCKEQHNLHITSTRNA